MNCTYCNKQAEVKGLCITHYKAFLRGRLIFKCYLCKKEFLNSLKAIHSYNGKHICSKGCVNKFITKNQNNHKLIYEKLGITRTTLARYRSELGIRKTGKTYNTWNNIKNPTGRRLNKKQTRILALKEALKTIDKKDRLSLTEEANKYLPKTYKLRNITTITLLCKLVGKVTQC